MKNVLLLGFGKSNQAVYEFLKTKKVNITILEEHKKSKSLPFVTLEDLKKEKPLFDLTIRSPGIPLKSEAYQLAHVLSKEVISEIEFAYRYLKKKHPHYILITGTNGKTTLTTMIHCVLSSKLPHTFLAGNIGIPLSSYLLKDIPEHSIFVVEISSFQLEDTISLKADDGIITNVDYNHLDEVYNYDFYVASKKRMGFLVKKNHLFFYDEIKEISLPHINLSSIPMEDDDINLPFFMGEHNHRHVKMSLYIGTLYGVSKEEGARTLYQLMPLPFRNEKILSSFTATIINDSKSTNVASTNQCLLTFQDKKRILILGGIAKSATFDHLLLKKEDEVYAYGRDRELVKVSIERAHLFSTLEEVMLAIEPDLHQDVYILFSPACSSYDQFENYMVRGTYFRQLIKRLEP